MQTKTMNPNLVDVLKVKIAAFLAIGTITLEVAHNWVGFLTACCALGYAGSKWFFLVKNKGVEKSKDTEK